MKKLTTEEFIKKCKSIHGEKYDYSIIEYNGSKSKVKIICKEHGIFEQLPYNHIMGKGCGKCKPQFGDKLKLEYFVNNSDKIHNFEYDYSLVEYINNKTKVKIICKKHGVFYQEPRNHLLGQKCPTCSGNKKITKSDFVERCSVLFDSKYDYSISEIDGVKSKTNIICKKHGIFTQVVESHLRGHGCPRCKDSKGEKIISWFLDKKNIKYEKQKMFDGCKDIRKLKFDFYIPEINTCIEFDGKHHFEVIEFGLSKLEDTVKKDKIKNKFCEENKIRLIRISYKQNIIEQLEDLLKQIK
jgi:very-short-patch-repair endonuclease